MTEPTNTQSPLGYVREAYLAARIDGLRYSLHGDQVTEILEVGDEWFAIGEEYDDGGELAGYSWAWGEQTEDDATSEVFTDYFGEDGGTTEAEARRAVATWLARFAR